MKLSSGTIGKSSITYHYVKLFLYGQLFFFKDLSDVLYFYGLPSDRCFPSHALCAKNGTKLIKIAICGEHNDELILTIFWPSVGSKNI